MRGDCSIRVDGIGFTPEQIAACSQQQGLLSIEIELSAAPRCTCTDCIERSPKPVLSPDEIKTVIDQARQMGAMRVILIDSDTGAYPPLGDLIEYLRARQLQIELFSADTEITAEFARFLFDRQVNVAIPKSSIDGSFAAIDQLKQAGYGSPDGPQLAIRIAVTSDNLDQIPTLWRWARNNNIDPHVQIITPRDSSNHLLQLLSPKRARQMLEELGRIDQQEFDRSWSISPSLIGRSCKRHLYATHVNACGTIFACVGVTIPLGNLRTEPLSEILKLSEVIEDIRAYSDKVKEPCKTCSQTVDCYGCRGAAYQLTGDYLAGDKLCWKAESTAIESLPVSVAHIIPHGPSIRMVDQLVKLGERRATTSFVIPDDSLWVDEHGILDELAYIEIIAQSFASSHGFHLTPQQRETHKGLLLGVSNVTVTGQAKVGDRLLIDIHKITRFGDFGIVEGDVHHEDGTPIATAQVKVWRPSDESAKALLP